MAIVSTEAVMLDFDWDDANIDHIARRGILPEEVEEAFLDPMYKRAPAYRNRTETRFARVGKTGEGRFLFLVYTPRGDRIRIVTARDAEDAEKRSYRRGRN